MCTCAANNACSFPRCSHTAAGIACTMICKCNGEHLVCFNPKNPCHMVEHEDDTPVINAVHSDG